jgi:glycosyltransferase involved in cell wall biosynthesis
MNVISVITPVYNGQSHIESCLKSVISQKCDNVEHIIVDGDSNDATIDIVKQYAEDHSHIRWISEPDDGQSDAMNKGIAIARGEILGILNVDDYYEQGVLKRIVELFEKLPEPSLLVGNCNVWDTQGNLKYINKPAKLNIIDLLLGWDINPHPVNPAAYFYHKSLHDIVGGYDTNNHYAMDLDFLLKAARYAATKYIDEIWGNYRELDGTKTAIDKQRGESRERAKEILREHRRKLCIAEQFQFMTLKAYYEYPKLLRRIFNKIQRKSGINRP